MVIANWYWFLLSVLLCPRRRLLLSGHHAAHLQPQGDDPRQGQPQGRRHRPDGIQRSGRLPEPPQRRQRGLHPPVAPPDGRRGQAPQPDDDLRREGAPAHEGSLRPVAHRNRLRRRQRQAVALDVGHAARRRQGAAARVLRQLHHQAGEPPHDHGRMRRHDRHAGGPHGRAPDLLHVAGLRGNPRST